jgi:Fe-Mn family superoxide dismutase
MGYTLPPLAYDHAALQPYIDEQTMRIHHDRYHLAYIERLNPVLEGTVWADKPIEEVLKNLDAFPADKKVAVRNMGGGHYNHSLFWEWLSPTGGGEPDGDLGYAIAGTYGSFENFKEALFDAGGRQLFGAGWAWLVHNGSALEVVLTANQDNPVMIGKTPLLGIDIWEHAYYPQYLSRRDYFEAWWNVVNWPKVAEKFAALDSGMPLKIRA